VGGAAPVETSWDDLLELALRGEGVRAEFQPIVDVRRRVVAGYEALARFDLAPGLGPDLWFAAAERRGVAARLELVALRAALAHRGDLPPNTFLTLNVEPASLADPKVLGLLAGQGHLGGLVIEITEHREIEDPERLVATLERLRAAGALVAVDEAKVALAEMLGTFANRVDAWLLAEGVETAGEAQRVEQLGIPLGQGWFYARPAPPFCSLERAVAELPRAEAPGRTGLHLLVHPLPSVPDGAGRASVASHDGAAVVEVDADGRPLGLVTTDSALADTVVQPLRANVHTTPAELASRLATQTPPDTSSPVIVTDNAGRYLGIVTVQRLLHHLADS
jgi:EAL domain-containing protein (putative c-di-GMP-specific phosphodiesterase class I)